MDLVNHLNHQNQFSYSQRVASFLSKTLLLSSASYFETRLSNAILDYATRISHGDEALISLVRNKAIERQYHTFFQWKASRSSMPFFGMFGSTIKDTAKQDLRDRELSQAADAFLELGDLRNLLVHENFAMYSLDRTPDEVYELYSVALRFVVYIEHKLNPPLDMTSLGEVKDETGEVV